MKSVFCPICVSLCLFRIQPFSVCALILQKNILLNLNVLAMKLKNFLKKAICSVPIVVVRSILLLCIYLSLGLVARAATQQRKITVSGIVTDSSGEPVIGASITEKGTSNGTISDVKGHFLGDKVLTRGTVTGSLVTPREIYLEALRYHAVSLILIHNHPSGDPTPSQEDMEITARIYQAGELLGIHLLDHIVIGDQRYCSFRETGLWDECTG